MARTKNKNVQKQIYPTMIRQTEIPIRQQNLSSPAFQMPPPGSERALNTLTVEEENHVDSLNEDRVEQPSVSAAAIEVIDLTEDDEGQASQPQDDGSIPMPLTPTPESQYPVETEVDQPLDILSLAMEQADLSLIQIGSPNSVKEIVYVEDEQHDTTTSLLDYECSTSAGTGIPNANDAYAGSATDEFIFKRPLQRVKSRPSININDVKYVEDLIKPCSVNVSHTEEVKNIINVYINSAKNAGVTAIITSPGAITLKRNTATRGPMKSVAKKRVTSTVKKIPKQAKRSRKRSVPRYDDNSVYQPRGSRSGHVPRQPRRSPRLVASKNVELVNLSGPSKVKVDVKNNAEVNSPRKNTWKGLRINGNFFKGRGTGQPSKPSPARFKEEQSLEAFCKSSLNRPGFAISFPKKQKTEEEMSLLESKIKGYLKSKKQCTDSPSCSTAHQEEKPRRQKCKRKIQNPESYTVEGAKFDKYGVATYHCVWNDGYGIESSSDEDNDSEDIYCLD